MIFYQIAMAVLAGLMGGLAIGYAIGNIQGRRNAMGLVLQNELKKMTSKIPAVGEFLAPGQHAEVVELGLDKCKNAGIDYTDKCHGCRYAGRYVFSL